MKKASISLILLIFLTPPLIGGACAGSAFNYEVDGEDKISVFIGFVGKPRADIIRRYGGEVRVIFRIVNVISANLSRKAIEAISKNPNVAYVEEIGRIRAVEQTTPWGVGRIEAPKAWSVTRGSGVKVAILDTGIDVDWNGTELLIIGGINFQGTVKDGSTDPKDWTDKNGHGTHVAGILAALDDDVLYVGVAPEAHIYAVKVLSTSGTGTYEDLIQGIEWAVYNGMQIISMSLGGSTNSQALNDTCRAAYEAGVLLVAAAGNDGDGDNANIDRMLYPAVYKSVIAVGGTDENNNVWYYSTTGPQVEISAPAKDIPSLWRYPLIAVASGTSTATPHVSGVAALIWAANPSLNNYEVRKRLQETATDLGPWGKDYGYGYGLVNASYAVLGKETSLNVSCNPTAINKYGDEATLISGFLTDANDRAGISGATVTLAYAYASTEYGTPPPDTKWTTIGTALTKADGSYSYVWDPPVELENGYYWISASFAGDAAKEYLQSSAHTGVDLVPNLLIVPEQSTALAVASLMAALAIFMLRTRRQNQQSVKTNIWLTWSI